MEWFRLYDGIIDDPKILRFSPEFRWFYICLLSVSSRNNERGTLPKREEIALHLRIRRRKLESVIAAFVDAGLIDVSEDGQTLTMHGWDSRQFKSDDVTARTKAFKERSRERSHPQPPGTFPERASRARSETETENTKDVFRPSSSPNDPHANSAMKPKRRPVNPCPAPPEVVASDPTFARIAAEDERRRHADLNGDR